MQVLSLWNILSTWNVNRALACGDQVNILLSEWRGKSFKTVTGALENLLVWDVDRRRIWMVKQLVSQVEGILLEVQETTSQKRAAELADILIDMQEEIGEAEWLAKTIQALSDLSNEGKDVLQKDPDRSYAGVFEWIKNYVQPNRNDGMLLSEDKGHDAQSVDSYDRFHAYLREWWLDEAREMARSLETWGEAAIRN